MKKLMLIMGLVFSTLMASAKYEPNTKWPYIYENFTSGTIYSTNNMKSEGKLNIHLSGNVLHYIGGDGKVYMSDDRKISRVEIGKDAYIYIDHYLMQVVGSVGEQVLLKYTKAEFSRMQSSTSGAYGTDLNTSSSRQLSSLDLGGLNTPELGKMLQERNDGAEIPLSIEYFFFMDGKKVEAKKSDVIDYLGADKADDFNKFVKENKIKWKNEDSLIAVLKYLSK